MRIQQIPDTYLTGRGADLSKAGIEFEAQRPIDRVTVPSYQVYLLLNVLERQGVVKTPSRGKYRFPRPLSNGDFEAVWRRVVEEEG